MRRWTGLIVLVLVTLLVGTAGAAGPNACGCGESCCASVCPCVAGSPCPAERCMYAVKLVSAQERISVATETGNARSVYVLTATCTATTAGGEEVTLPKGTKVVGRQYVNKGNTLYLMATIETENGPEDASSVRGRNDLLQIMVGYSKENVLGQSGVSMLEQANQSTNGLLTLLR